MSQHSRPNCVVPDCDYKTHEEGGKCYAHGLGLNPVMSFAEYLREDTKPLYERRNSLGQLVWLKKLL
jgi:hypothetical protein